MREIDLIIAEINKERERQDLKWGTQDAFHNDHFCASAVLLEEAGEVARAILEKDIKNLKRRINTSRCSLHKMA